MKRTIDNCTFLFGCRGSGKTEALHDYMDKIRKEKPKEKILIVRKRDLENESFK